MSPEFIIIRLKNNGIYLKPDESFIYIGEEFRFHHSSRFRKKAGDANSILPHFDASFDVFSSGVLPESGGVGTPAGTPFTMGKG